MGACACGCGSVQAKSTGFDQQPDIKDESEDVEHIDRLGAEDVLKLDIHKVTRHNTDGLTTSPSSVVETLTTGTTVEGAAGTESPASAASGTACASDAEGTLASPPVIDGNSVEDLEEEADWLAEVRRLCQRLQLLDAGAALDKIKLEITEAEGGFASQKLESLRADPVLCKLCSIHGRLSSALKDIAIPALRTDVDWNSLDFADPEIYRDYHFQLKLRHADANEFDQQLGGTQLVSCCQVTNFPMDMVSRMALEYETDLFKQKWLKDCELWETFRGGPEQLYSNFIRLRLAPKIAPLRIEDVMVREFSVCETSPFPGLPPGVLKVESVVPDDATEFEGWSVPPPTKGVTRMGNTKMFYITPSETGNCVNVLIMARVNLSIPRWLIPLNLVKRFVAGQISNAMKQVREQILPHWAEFGYADRVASCPELYDHFRRLSYSSSGTPSASL